MLLHLILGSAAVLGVAFACGLVLLIVGIQRGDHGKRLTGRPAGLAEILARRMLTGSRGYHPRDDAEDGPR